jgi:hypothetical protein
MHVGLGLLIVAVIFIPIMLLVKPCCFRGDPGHDEEQDEIEFTNINNRGGDAEQNMQIQRGSADGTDDAMRKR